MGMCGLFGVTAYFNMQQNLFFEKMSQKYFDSLTDYQVKNYPSLYMDANQRGYMIAKQRNLEQAQAGQHIGTLDSRLIREQITGNPNRNGFGDSKP